jgi:predicted ATPase
MLTRLKIKGFKNLLDVDVRFGAFTCIAGANGVGKSNLFDAIRFLSALADQPLVDAALSMRSRTGDVRNLFARFGQTFGDTIAFEAEMIIPATGLDDLGQHAEASITFVRYSVAIAYRQDHRERAATTIEILHEALVPIPLGEWRQHLSFPHHAAWRRSVLRGRRTTPFISTFDADGQRMIRVHGDGRASRPRDLRAASLPRTALSTANATDSATMALVRNEMRSWRMLQLEPAALRTPDALSSPTILATDGGHLPATLYFLAALYTREDTDLYGQIASRLAELIDGVRSLRVERDERLGLLTLFVAEHDRTEFPASVLSDGTLRFLALATALWDPRLTGIICLEEPENGISPERIPAMLRLLQDIAVDPHQQIGQDNPLRQVIVNTHAPAVVQHVRDDSLLVADAYEAVRGQRRVRGARFACLSATWREVGSDALVISRGKLLAYLSPVTGSDADAGLAEPHAGRRVIDRPDLRLLVPFELP